MDEFFRAWRCALFSLWKSLSCWKQVEGLQSPLASMVGEAARRMPLGCTESACERDRGLRSTQRVSADWVGLKSSLNAQSLQVIENVCKLLQLSPSY
jgi:hypothetical protein